MSNGLAITGETSSAYYFFTAVQEGEYNSLDLQINHIRIVPWTTPLREGHEAPLRNHRTVQMLLAPPRDELTLLDAYNHAAVGLTRSYTVYSDPESPPPVLSALKKLPQKEIVASELGVDGKVVAMQRNEPDERRIRGIAASNKCFATADKRTVWSIYDDGRDLPPLAVNEIKLLKPDTIKWHMLQPDYPELLTFECEAIDPDFGLVTHRQLVTDSVQRFASLTTVLNQQKTQTSTPIGWMLGEELGPFAKDMIIFPERPTPEIVTRLASGENVFTIEF